MIMDNIVVKAPAKINLFFRILNRREDGYHNIRSGITFINLFDEVNISMSNNTSVRYHGPFAPLRKIFYKDIIIKTLNILNIKKDIKLKISIKKNIPTKAGLGSASTDAAALIKGLFRMKVLKKTNDKLLSKIGADVPVCYYTDNCLVTGMGDQIYFNVKFPKYYFVLVKPNIDFSTSVMYEKIKTSSINLQNNNKLNNLISVNKNDIGNDFEKIAKIKNKEISTILNFLLNIDNCIFSRMTGSGSCCYAVFYDKKSAIRAFEVVKLQYANYWTYFGKNNV